MNPTRPGALPVTWNRRLALLSAFFLFATPPLFAAPKKAPAKPQGIQADVPAPDQHLSTAKDLLLSAGDEKKAEAIASFIDGTIAEDNADADGAIEDYRKVLAVDPAARIRTEEGSDALMLLSAKVGFELARRGDPAAGIDLLKDTVKADPKDPMAYFFLSQLYSKFLKKYDIALKYASQALEMQPDNFSFYLANYEQLLNLGQNKKAEELLERATKQGTDDPEFWLKLSELYVRSRVKDDGSASPEDQKKMNELFQKALATAKDDPAAVAKVADFYVLTRQVKEAIPLYLEVLKMKHTSNDQTKNDVREKLAGSFIATGQRDEAIKTLQDLIKANPLSYSSYEMLGKLYAETGDYDKALASYQQTLLLSPNDWRNYMYVLDMMIQLKKFDKAVDLMREARKTFPDIPRITYGLGLALSGAKKGQEAVDTFEQAQNEAMNSDTAMLTGEFYFNYGAAAEQAGLLPKAVEMFRKSIDLDPANAAQAYNYLGFMWVDRGQNLDEAGDLIKRALELDPDNPAYVDSLGWYYFKKGEFNKALTELLKAASNLKPEDPVVYEHIGDTYQKLGNSLQAVNYWQKAVALDPDNKKLAGKIEEAKQKVTALPEKPAAAAH